MEVEFQTNKQDFIDFYKIQLRDTLLKKSVGLVISLILIIVCIYQAHFILHTLILVVIGIILVLMAVSYFIPLVIIHFRLTRMLSNEKRLIQKRKFIILDEGLLSEGEGHSLLRNWESIKLASSNEKFIYLRLIDKKVLIVPIRDFPSQTDAINFLGILESKTIAARGLKDFTLYKNEITKRKPPYLLGLLCIIPLIGAFMGVALILYGLFKYKDIWLTIIGIAGIVFTVAVYYPMDKLNRNKTLFNKGFETLDNNQLNSLVKEIEFYKIQNGFYPDSLQQLDNLINIHDPMLNGEKNDKYNYHRIGNKYTLFSSGVDEIPGTSDDIYPSLKVDTSKIGLIVK